jgi:hypothetical protein
MTATVALERFEVMTKPIADVFRSNRAFKTGQAWTWGNPAAGIVHTFSINGIHYANAISVDQALRHDAARILGNYVQKLPLAVILRKVTAKGGTMTARAKKPDETETVVQWPDTIVSTDTKDIDLGPPLKQLLQDLGIKGTTDDEATADKPKAALAGTPVSVSIIEAGATAASKGWAALIAALGGATAVWGAASDLWKSESAIQGDLVIAAAVVLAACALGVALIMYGDVRARGQGAAAQYSARAAIATAFLRGAAAVKPPAPPSGPSTAAPADQPPATKASTPPAKTPESDDFAEIRAELKATQTQVSGISKNTEQILKAVSERGSSD